MEEEVEIFVLFFLYHILLLEYVIPTQGGRQGPGVRGRMVWGREVRCRGSGVNVSGGSWGPGDGLEVGAQRALRLLVWYFCV